MASINVTLKEIKLPQQKLVDLVTYNSGEKHLFPTVLSPTDNVATHQLITTIKSNMAQIEESLLSSGAVLLRGFPILTASDFNDVIVEALGYEDFPYEGLGSRHKVIGRVYTANEAPPEKKIPFHHELSHLSQPPSKVLFFCEEEPKSGGETAILSSNLIYELIRKKHPDFVAKLEQHGLRSVGLLNAEAENSSPIGRGWKATFSTDEKSVAEEKVAKMGQKLEWIGDVGKITLLSPAFKVDQLRGNKTWANTLILWYGWRDSSDGQFKMTYGDGTPLPEEIVGDCFRMFEEESVAVPWKKGDVLLLDNLIVLHSRRSFQPPRRILASFGK